VLGRHGAGSGGPWASVPLVGIRARVIQGVGRKLERIQSPIRRAGGLLMACGNGGSMCDAMHFAEEWTGRFRGDREAKAALAFSDPSHLTCIANDFGYDEVLAREVAAYGKPGDLLLAISTSGNSPNVLRACETARERGVKTVGLLGKGGGELRELVDIPIIVPVATTSDRIQEIHIKFSHIVIETVERSLFPENYA
jgi:D-sedoheptulose 7-phosphate isomerase